MAAILRLRRGTSTPTLLESELFFNTTSETLVVGEGTGSHTLVKIGSNTGDVSFIGDITASNMLLTGDLVVKDITLSGNIYVGDELTDTITVTGQFDSNLLPSASDEFDLGSTSKKWNNLYVVSASIQNLDVGGSGILSSSQQITDYNTFLEIDGMNVVSGSSQIDLTQTTNYISGIKTRLNTETVISGSSQVDITQTDGYTTFSSSIATTDEGQNDRLDNIETFTASLDVTFEEIASSTHTLVSGSSQIDVNTTQNFQTFSSSVDTRLDEVESTSSINETNITELFSTSSDHESRVDELEVTGSDHETRIDSLESFSSSLDNTFVTETELNLATSSLSASLTETDVDFESRIIEIETTFSSSVDSRLDSQESFSSSIDTTIKTKMNLDNVLSGSTQITNGSGILSSSNEDFNTFSSSIDGRVDSIETTFSSSVDSRLDSLEGDSHTHSNKTQLDTINQNLSNTSNVTFNDITASGNVIVSGDLTVLGTATEIQTSDLYIKDKLITVASGSTNSAEADGSGIEIDGAGKSIIWDDATQSFILNAQVSSSVGFKGDGSQLTGVTAADVEYLDVLNKPTLVSGSSQISFNGIIDKPTLFSGSSQVNADTIINFDSNVKDKMNLDNVISGSTQITDGSGLLSSSNENFTTFSSSIDGRVDLLETTFSSSVDSRLDEIETTFSSSVDSRLLTQEIFSESLDTKYLNTDGDSVVSGSSQIDVTQTTNIATIATTGSNVFIGNQTITGSLNISGSNIEIESPMTSSNTIEATFFYGDGSNLTNIIASEITYEDITNLPSGLVSGSSQIDVTQTTNYSSIRQYDDSDNTSHLNSIGVVSGSTYSSPSQGTLRATINGVDSDVDLGLQSIDTPTFNSLTASNLPEHDNTHYDALFKGTSGEFGYRTLGNAAFYMVSSSISDGNPDVLGNAGAVKDYIDEALIEVGAGDITKITAGDGISGGADSGEAIINLDTGSQHFNNGIKLKLDLDNLHSGSYLGTSTTSDLDEGVRLYYTDLRVKTKLDLDGVVSGSVLRNLDGTGILSSSNENFTDFSSSVDNRIDLLESFSSSLDNDFVTELELNTATQSLQDSIDLKLDISTYTPFSSSVDSRLDGLEGITSENPLTFTDTSTIDFDRDGDTITANVIGGVVSGSSQVIDILDSLNTYTASNDVNQTTQDGRLTSLEAETGSIATEQDVQDVRLDNLETYTASLDTVYEEKSSATHTLVSGSSQIDVTQTTNYSSINQYSDAKVKLKLDADGVFSSSFQVNADNITNFDTNVKTKLDTDGVISGSDQLTGSLVDLTSDQTIGGVKTFDDIVVNGTGSFAYFISTETELNTIGQSFIVLNNDTPTQRYAGLAVYDSGSAGVTASLQFDGQTNDWFYEYSDDNGVTTDHGVVMFGPEFSTKGSPTYNTNNTILKSNGGHHTLDSNITDDGSTITLGSNTFVDGVLSVGGSFIQTITGTLGLTATGGISLLTDGGTDGITIAQNGNTTIYGALALQDIATAGTATSALVVGAGNVVSQRTLGSNAFTSTSIPTNNNELTNGAGYITGFDITTQTDDKYLRSDTNDTASGIITFSNTTQSTSNTTGAVIVSGGVGIAKTLNVGEDVVAYASSDRRLKDNILPISNPLQKINSIGGYSFDWNVEKQHIYKGKDYGVIAQEIEGILPELVDTRENGYKAVKYDKLVSLLIEGIKELSQEVDELKKQINK